MINNIAMGLFNNDSSKTALSMGRVILILKDIESKVNNGADIYDFKDDIEFMIRKPLLVPELLFPPP